MNEISLFSKKGFAPCNDAVFGVLNSFMDIWYCTQNVNQQKRKKTGPVVVKILSWWRDIWKSNDIVHGRGLKIPTAWKDWKQYQRRRLS